MIHQSSENLMSRSHWSGGDAIMLIQRHQFKFDWIARQLLPLCSPLIIDSVRRNQRSGAPSNLSASFTCARRTVPPVEVRMLRCGNTDDQIFASVWNRKFSQEPSVRLLFKS